MMTKNQKDALTIIACIFMPAFAWHFVGAWLGIPSIVASILTAMGVVTEGDTDD